MRAPEELTALVDDGIIDEVLRPLMSGKEAQIYLVVCKGEEFVAKVYKDAQRRSFKNRADYTEGRKVRNSRDQRAINSGSRHGREQDEASWRNTEVDTIYKLHYAGVRVPSPLHYVEGVLVMELVRDASGFPAPRLGDVRFTPGEATEIYQFLVQQVVRMACAGVVHGDLSDFNVLIGANGPVIIDFPQAVDPARNLNARKLLLRDVENLHRFVSRFAPGTRRLPYAEEIWNLLEQNTLTPETRLTGRVRGSDKRVDTEAVLSLIGDANRDEQRRRDRNAAARPRPSNGAARDGREGRPSTIETPAASNGVGPRPRRVEIVIPTSHRSPRTPTGDWPRSRSPGPATSGPRHPGGAGARSDGSSGASRGASAPGGPRHGAPGHGGQNGGSSGQNGGGRGGQNGGGHGGHMGSGGGPRPGGAQRPQGGAQRPQGGAQRPQGGGQRPQGGPQRSSAGSGGGGGGSGGSGGSGQRPTGGGQRSGGYASPTSSGVAQRPAGQRPGGQRPGGGQGPGAGATAGPSASPPRFRGADARAEGPRASSDGDRQGGNPHRRRPRRH